MSIKAVKADKIFYVRAGKGQPRFDCGRHVLPLTQRPMGYRKFIRNAGVHEWLRQLDPVAISVIVRFRNSWAVYKTVKTKSFKLKKNLSQYTKKNVICCHIYKKNAIRR